MNSGPPNIFHVPTPLLSATFVSDSVGCSWLYSILMTHCGMVRTVSAAAVILCTSYLRLARTLSYEGSVMVVQSTRANLIERWGIGQPWRCHVDTLSGIELHQQWPTVYLKRLAWFTNADWTTMTPPYVDAHMVKRCQIVDLLTQRDCSYSSGLCGHVSAQSDKAIWCWLTVLKKS